MRTKYPVQAAVMKMSTMLMGFCFFFSLRWRLCQPSEEHGPTTCRNDKDVLCWNSLGPGVPSQLWYRASGSQTWQVRTENQLLLHSCLKMFAAVWPKIDPVLLLFFRINSIKHYSITTHGLWLGNLFFCLFCDLGACISFLEFGGSGHWNVK